jgi:hypothetical protein
VIARIITDGMVWGEYFVWFPALDLFLSVLIILITVTLFLFLGKTCE